MSHSLPWLTIRATDRAALDGQLDAAVERLRGHAAVRRCGILVTRLATDRFDVRPSFEVPYGQTYERQNY